MRAAVATADGKRTASVIGYVDVPNLRQDGLALSEIILTGSGAPTLPTLQREFAPGEPIGIACEVARAKADGAPVHVQYAVSDQLGRSISGGDMAAGNGSDVARTYVAAIRLPPAQGRYVVTIDASSGKRSVQRQIPLVVR